MTRYVAALPPSMYLTINIYIDIKDIKFRLNPASYFSVSNRALISKANNYYIRNVFTKNVRNYCLNLDFVLPSISFNISVNILYFSVWKIVLQSSFVCIC